MLLLLLIMAELVMSDADSCGGFSTASYYDLYPTWLTSRFFFLGQQEMAHSFQGPGDRVGETEYLPQSQYPST